MKKKLFCFLLLMTLTACQTIRFQPPLGVKYLVSCIEDEDGVIDCACIVDDLRDDLPAKVEDIRVCNNVKGVQDDYYLELEQFYQDKLTRLEICLKYPKKCR